MMWALSLSDSNESFQTLHDSNLHPAFLPVFVLIFSVNSVAWKTAVCSWNQNTDARNI